jgi:hypothetical protein
MPATTETGRTARLEKRIARLHRGFFRRKLAGRNFDSLLLLCRRLSADYLESINSDRLAS